MESATSKARKPRRTGINVRERQMPEVERKIEIACKRLSEDALDFLVKVMLDDGQETRWRLQAAKEIMDRGLGKPKQSVDQKVTINGGEGFLALIQEAKERADREQPSIATPVDMPIH